MTKFSFLLMLLMITFFSCKKDAPKQNSQTDDISLVDAAVLKKGNFIFSSEKNKGGVAKIYHQKNGKYVLAFEQMSIKNNIDLNVYLSNAAVYLPSSKKLFSIKYIEGEFYYQLPQIINSSDFSFVVLQNDVQQQAFATAELR